MTELCSHLVSSGHLSQPFALIHTDDASAFTCPQCSVDYGVVLLDAGATAKEVLLTIHFTKCEHGQGICFPCVEAFKSELRRRWAALRASDPAASNRLGKLRKLAAKVYDRDKA